MKKTNMNERIISIMILKFVLLSLFALTHQGFVIMPQSEGLHWEKISSSDLKCPPYDRVKDAHAELSQYEELQAEFPSSAYNSIISGTSCQIVSVSTTCRENWFAGREISYSSVVNQVNTALCQAELNSKSVRLPVVPPSVECAYWSQQHTTDTTIDLSPLGLHYDPYVNGYIHPMFESGICRKSPCVSANKRVAWIAGEGNPNPCEMEKRSIWTDGQGPDRIIHSHLAPPKFGAPCVMNFCGKRGFKFADGEWMNILGAGYDDPQFKPCVNKSVSIYKPGLVDQEEGYLEDAIASNRCYDMISTVRESGTISSWNLGVLNPKSQGLHFAYRLRNGNIERTLASFLKVIYLEERFSGVVGYTESHTPVNWTDWVSHTNTTKLGPNGVLWLTGAYGNESKLLFPESAIQLTDHSHYTTEPLVIQDYYTGIIINGTDEEDIHDIRHHLQEETFYEESLVWSLFHSRYTWIILSIIVIVPLVKRFCSCCLFGPKKPSPSVLYTPAQGVSFV